MDREEKRRMAIEYQEDLKAAKAPMRHVGDQGSLEYVSKVAAKKVLEDAKRADVPEEVVAAMRERMRKWYRIVLEYKAEMDAVRRDENLKGNEKDVLLATMEQNLEACYNDVYGQ